MNKTIKLATSVFVGLDVFVFCWFSLAQLRVSIFGFADVPDVGAAFDMAIFLFPAFLGFLAGNRLYYFLNYKERREKALQQQLEKQQEKLKPPTLVSSDPGAIWEEADWQDEKPSPDAAADLSISRKQE